MKQGFIIPVYNHGKTVAPIVEKLSKKMLPIILIDDGSNAETKKYLADTAAAFPLTVLVTLEKNSGKGGAVSAGIDKAYELGLTHVLQIDADGQHDVDRAFFFLEQSSIYQQAAICSYPEYDESVPENRRKGRIIGNTMAKIVTLSGDIKDAMCGFRVYPVKDVWHLIHCYHFDYRMGFDIEILVRLYWKNIQLLFYPINVKYFKDGISHFHLFYDNVRISWMFTKLFFGMLIRFPLLVYRNCIKHARNMDYGK